jgi:glycosyltransferase involved in cell wall biosynthesis
MARVPFLIVGDAPEGHSGLGRILRDLRRRLTADAAFAGGLDLDVKTCAWVADPKYRGTPPCGLVTGLADWRFMNITSWGREAVESAWQYFYGDRPGIVFTIWDPARCHAFLELPAHLTKWGYFAVDGHNRHGTFGGPAAEAVKGYQRVLAYGAYGAEVLTTVRADGTHVEALPHGIDTNVFKPTMTAAARASAERLIGARLTPQTRVIGCVATNQARKDLGLVFETMASLIMRGQDVHLWLHIDEQVTEAWSVPQLYEDYPELRGRLSVSQSVTDEVLAACYASCSVTIAPGRGEGFGYPILESQWCGTPVVGFDYAGGAEYLPAAGQARAYMYRPEGPYNLLRPIGEGDHWASLIEALLLTPPTWTMPPAAHQTRWSTLWPEWREWVAAGLTDWRETHGH